MGLNIIFTTLYAEVVIRNHLLSNERERRKS